MLLLVDYGKVLWSFVNELQQNSDTFSKEEYILGNILTVFVVDSSRLHLTFEAFYLLSAIHKKKGKTIKLLHRPIRAPDQTPDRFYIISMEFLSLSRRRSSWWIVSSEEQGETAVFAGYPPKQALEMLWITWEGEGLMRSWVVQQAHPSPK